MNSTSSVLTNEAVKRSREDSLTYLGNGQAAAAQIVSKDRRLLLEPYSGHISHVFIEGVQRSVRVGVIRPSGADYKVSIYLSPLRYRVDRAALVPIAT